MVRRSALPGYIVEVLTERYPEKTVPHGTWRALSEELGISPAHIRSVATRNSWRVDAPHPERTVWDVRAAVLSRLESHVPCTEAPYGIYASLARELGVSPQYVRKVALEAGWKSSANRSTKGTYLCQCGTEVSSARATCRECRWVEVGCEECGQPVRRRIEELVRRRRTDLYSGRIFCNRECFAAFRKGRPRSK